MKAEEAKRSLLKLEKDVIPKKVRIEEELRGKQREQERREEG